MKKSLVILLVIILTLSFAGCTSKKANTDLPDESTNIFGGDEIPTITPVDDGEKPDDDGIQPDDKSNEKPTIVIEEKVDYGESLAGVKYDGKWGYINMEGNFVIEPQYNSVYTFNYGAAVVELDDVPILINKKNDVLFSSDLDHFNIYSGTEGMFKTNRFTMYGYVNYKGEVIAEPIYYNLGDFSNGLCTALEPPHDGYINKAGEFVIEPAYNDAEEFSEGFAIVWNNGKCGFINTDGEPLTDMIYDKATAFSDGMAKIRVGKKWGFIDTTGKVVIEPQFEDYVGSFSEDRAQIIDGNLTGYIDKTGEIVIEPKFEIADDFHDSYARVIVDPFEKYSETFIDKDGNFITELKFETVRSFKEGMAIIERDQKYGFINTDGEIVVDLIYDEVHDFSNGLAAVCVYDKENDKENWGYIDKTGKMVIEPKFSLAQDFEVIPE